MSDAPQQSKRSVLLVAITAVILLLPLAYSVVASLIPRDAEAAQVFLERPAPEHERCVKDTTYMRFHHWELLRVIREEVVRYGKRGEIGLRKCKDCHTSRERFCNQCHNAVSLYPDCFDCHYYPEVREASSTEVRWYLRDLSPYLTTAKLDGSPGPVRK